MTELINIVKKKVSIRFKINIQQEKMNIKILLKIIMGIRKK